MARPTKAPEDKRNERNQQRYTAAEYARIEAAAADLGMKPSDFIRACVLKAPLPKPRTAKADAAAVARLDRIGVHIAGACNNMNQLTRATHRGSDFQDYWREVGEEQKAVLADLRTVLDTLLQDFAA
ncbi:MAG: hypothetical protein AAFV59_07465 [Pseudomonadota bacterium]